MHPKIAASLFVVTATYLVLVIAQQPYTPDPYSSSQSRNSQDPYYNQSPYNDQRYNSSQDRYNNPDQRYNNPDQRYNNPDQRYNNPDQRYNQDRYNNPDQRYNQDRYNNPDQRYNQDRNNQDRYGQGQGQGQDRYNQDRNSQDRYNQDRYGQGQDRYNQDRYNQDRYGSGNQGSNRPPYGQQPAYGGGNYDTRTGSGFGGDDGNCCEEFCYRRIEPYLHFATKTAYQFSLKHSRSDQFKIPQCQPVVFWSLNKHGARLPSAMLIPRLRNLESIRQQILMNYEQRQTYPRNGRMCEDDLDLFRRWRWNESIIEQRAYSLTSQGAEDLRILARKFQSHLRPFLDTPYNEQYYKFQYTEADKIHDSYQAFVDGLFPTSAYRIHADVLPYQSPGYSSCYGSEQYSGRYGSSGQYGSSSGQYGGSGGQYGSSSGQYGGSGGQYGSSSGQYGGGSGQYGGSSGQYGGGSGQYGGTSGQYGSTSGQYGSTSGQYGGASGQYGGSGGQYGGSGGYSSSGGYGGEDSYGLQEYYKFKQRPEYKDLVRDVSRRLGFKYNINETVVEAMYEICRYEKAWYPRDPAAWCASFSERQLKILEYAEDLKYYYKYGYGNEMNAQRGCQPIKEMYERFERVVNGAESEKVVISFKDTATLQLVLVSLGVAKDFNRLTAETYNSQTRRQWRTSTLTPFAANLVAILHQCSQGESYKVMFYLNESPLDIPGCQVGLCSWNVFKSKAEEAIRNCNVNCPGGASSIKSNSFMFSLSIVLVATIFYKLFF